MNEIKWITREQCEIIKDHVDLLPPNFSLGVTATQVFARNNDTGEVIKISSTTQLN